MFENELIFYHFGHLNIECFQRANIWYEYYSPFELDDFRKIGLQDDWIDRNIYKFLDADVEMYYSFKKETFRNREFTFLGCKIKERGDEFFATLSLVAGELTSVNFKISDQEFSFYTKKMLASDENYETLISLSKFLKTDDLPLELFYILDKDIVNQFNIPKRIDLGVDLNLLLIER